jgi:hypothetical protein
MYSAKGADMTKGIDGESSSNIAQLCTCDPPDSAVTANMLAIVAEVTDYSKQYLDNRAAFVETRVGRQRGSDPVRVCEDVVRGLRRAGDEDGRTLFQPRQVGFNRFGLAMANTQGMADSQGMKP